MIAAHFAAGEAWAQAALYFSRAGDAASKLGAHVEARRHYEASLEALARSPATDETRRRQVDTALALVAISYVSDPARNLAHLLEAAEIAEALPGAHEAVSEDRRRLCRVHLWIGRCQYYLGAPAEALPHYHRVLEMARPLGDEALVAQAAESIGRTTYLPGYFAQSVGFIEESLGPLERCGNWPEWILNACMVGLALALRGDLADAVALTQRGIERAEAIRNLTSIAFSYIVRAGVGLSGGALEPCREHLRLGVDAAERAGDRVYTHLGYVFIAWSESRLDNHEEARAAMDHAKEIAASVGQRITMVDWREAMEAEIAARAGRFDEAIALAAPAVARFRAGDRIFAEGIAQRAWGVALAAQGALAEAEEHLREGVRLFDLGGARMEAARARGDLARVIRQRGDHEAARSISEAAAAQLEAGSAAAEAAAVRAASA
jgi:tetratricopeptide (TPR) repeat protein